MKRIPNEQRTTINDQLFLITNNEHCLSNIPLPKRLRKESDFRGIAKTGIS